MTTKNDNDQKIVVKPVVYGSTAQRIGKTAEGDGRTHQWTVYVKPFHNEDMSRYVKKVVFKLHESYANNTRSIVKPPYEINETGWGEFSIQIRIHFNGNMEPPVTLHHMLKLFQRDVTTVVSETYDELLFINPNPMMEELLAGPLSGAAYKHHTDYNEQAEKQVEQLRKARQRVKDEMNNAKEGMDKSSTVIAKLKRLNSSPTPSKRPKTEHDE